MPIYRHTPEDFQVEELPLFPPTGDGGFLALWIEKRLQNTADVARDLGHALGVAQRDVGYAGRKDRRAVSRQWFTVPRQSADAVARLDFGSELPGVRLLDTQPTGHRLRTGQLLGNRFRIVVRDVSAEQAEHAGDVLERMSRRGMPNRYGHQRFGRDGRNAERGRGLLDGGRIKGDRRRAWLMISALQSQVFNAVLEKRPMDELWPGDLALSHATSDWRWIDDPADHAADLESFKISPTGPIFGTKVRRPHGKVATLEKQVMQELDLPAADAMRPPKGVRLYGDRRSLRARVGDLAWSHQDDVFEIAFELPAGSYATVLLEDAFGDQLEEAAVS